MKIALFDPYLLKFTKDMVDHWVAQGHEVRVERYYNPANAEWADIIWFDTCDNNLASATNPGSAILDDSNNYSPWDLHDMDLTGKKIIVRPIDIEVWQGAQHAAKWDLVDEVIFIAPHIRDIFDINLNKPAHVIPCSVNLDRYRYREHSPGLNVGIVSEKWTSKGTDLILQVAEKLQRTRPYKFSWLGRWSDHPWEIKYFEDFIKHKDLNFEFIEWIEGDNAVDEFLEDKDYLLHASHKEGFSYATAEAMAKGIKPVTHRFYGADDLWPGVTWSTIDEAVGVIAGANIEGTTGWYKSEKYRQYLVDHGYTVPQMMEKIDKVIKGE